MKPTLFLFWLAAALAVAGCGKAANNPAAGAPPSAQVVEAGDLSLFRVNHPDQYPLATAIEHDASSSSRSESMGYSPSQGKSSRHAGPLPTLRTTARIVERPLTARQKLYRRPQ